jgi:PqqD family protein of HPr-rel-A system
MAIRARTNNLVVESLGDEVLVFDQESEKCHALNKTAAIVWQHCDGQATLTDLAAKLAAETSLPADEDIVRFALGQLGKAGLLEEPISRPSGEPSLSRRRLIKKFGLVGGLALLLPVVESIVAPDPVMAQSGTQPPTQPPTPTT